MQSSGMQEERYLQGKVNRPEKNKQSIYNLIKEKINHGVKNGTKKNNR
nr:MAG TPA: hypothetical protein [Caudoviricetes sp.]